MCLLCDILFKFHWTNQCGTNSITPWETCTSI